tara:strand:+ start:27 stop:350 length:324 start_codon:yes stop_codon:yes gene_type:complete
MKLVQDGEETVLRVALKEVALVFTEHGMFAHIPPGFDPRHDDAPDHIPHHIAMALMAMLVVENYGELVGLIESTLSNLEAMEKQQEPTLEEAMKAVIKSLGEDIQEA